MSEPTAKTDKAKNEERTSAEERKEALWGIQGDLLNCMGDLIILDDFLSGDPLQHMADLPHVLLSMSVLANNARERVKVALDRTHKVL